MTQPVTKARLVWALVLNALVMPGSGHIMLGYRITGTVISLVVVALVFVCLISYSSSYIQAAFRMQPEADSIARIVEASSLAYRENRSLILGSLTAIALAWTCGVADIIVRIARHRDHA